MIRKILCWLGFHEWERQIDILEFETYAWWKEEYGKTFYVIWDRNEFICKHCGKIKRF